MAKRMAESSFIHLPQDRAGGGRYPSIDIARGIIMVIMSLDHASQTWNAGRPAPEIAGLGPIDYGGVLQQITRESTHICAPGFQLLAGMGLSISVWRRQAAGQSQAVISADMALRGGVLLFCDFVLMHFAYDRIPFFFLVLACIGGSTILFSVLRKLPLPLICLFALAVILGGPLYAKGHIIEPSARGYVWNALFNVALTESPDNMAYLVLYPVFPWIGCFALGWCLGTYHERNQFDGTNRGATARAPLAIAGVAMFAAALLLRAIGRSYADPQPLGSIASPQFWMLTKYPPSPAFLLATLGLNFVLIGVLRPLDDRSRLGPLWRILLTFGNVSLFYFVIHMHLYGVYPVLSDTLQTYSLGTTYLVWIAGLVLMFPPCVGYRALRNRYRMILRYF